jgi:two-component system NtrC family sensor kinase
MRTQTLFLFASAVLSCSFLIADARLVVLSDTSRLVPIGQQVQYFVDPSGALALPDILEKASAGEFTRGEQDMHNFAPSEHSVWYLLTYENPGEESWWLEVGDAFSVWELDFYHRNSADGVYHLLYELGGLRPQERKLFPSNYFFVPLPAHQSDSVQTVLFRVGGYFPKSLSLQVGKIVPVMEKTKRNEGIFAVFLGIILAIIIYNLFLYFSTWETLYLKYIGYLAVMLWVISFSQGHPLYYHPFIYERVFEVNAIQFLAIPLFVSHYLNLKTHAPGLRLALWLFSSLFLLVLPLLNIFQVLDFQLIGSMYQVLSPLCFLFLFYVGIVLTIRKVEGALFFLLAWSALIFSIIAFFLTINNLLPQNIITRNIAYIGLCLEALLFAFALGDRFSKLKSENLRIQAEKIQLVEQQNEILESRVQAKTRELHEAYLHSQDLNKKLQQSVAGLEKSNEELNQQRTHLNQTLEKLKNTQEQLIEAEKLASLGILTAGVAHELNNPLNFIKSGATALEMGLEEQPALKEDMAPLFEAIEEGIDRATRIVKSLGKFSREDDLPPATCDLHEIIDSCLGMLANQCQGKIEIVKKYDLAEPFLWAREGQLHQAFLNVLANAVQAVEESGVISIETRLQNEYLEIQITDTGKGITAEDMKHIFDPFFTTKAPGKGTGLGLAITQKIVREHGGDINCQSMPAQGTTFVIRFPKSISIRNHE